MQHDVQVFKEAPVPDALLPAADQPRGLPRADGRNGRDAVFQGARLPLPLAAPSGGGGRRGLLLLRLRRLVRPAGERQLRPLLRQKEQAAQSRRPAGLPAARRQEPRGRDDNPRGRRAEPGASARSEGEGRDGDGAARVDPPAQHRGGNARRGQEEARHPEYPRQPAQLFRLAVGAQLFQSDPDGDGLPARPAAHRGDSARREGAVRAAPDARIPAEPPRRPRGSRAQPDVAHRAAAAQGSRHPRGVPDFRAVEHGGALQHGRRHSPGDAAALYRIF